MAQDFVVANPGRPLRRAADQSSLNSAFFTDDWLTYFTDKGLWQTFAHHGLTLVESRNLNAYRKAGLGATLAAAVIRLPFGSSLISSLPEKWVYQRCYVARCAAPE
jgi:hypothetical protein